MKKFLFCLTCVASYSVCATEQKKMDLSLPNQLYTDQALKFLQVTTEEREKSPEVFNKYLCDRKDNAELILSNKAGSEVKDAEIKQLLLSPSNLIFGGSKWFLSTPQYCFLFANLAQQAMGYLVAVRLKGKKVPEERYSEFLKELAEDNEMHIMDALVKLKKSGEGKALLLDESKKLAIAILEKLDGERQEKLEAEWMRGRGDLDSDDDGEPNDDVDSLI